MAKTKRAPEPERSGERELVAALLLEPGALADVSALVRPADFSDPRLGAVFGALETLHAQGDPTPADDAWLPTLARTAANGSGVLSYADAAPFVAELVDERILAPRGAPRFYARQIREVHLRRELAHQLRMLEATLETASPEENEEAWRALEATRAELATLAETDHPLGHALLFGERLLERSLRPPPPTIVPGLLYPGKLTVLVGAPFVGKSFLALHLGASHACGLAPWPGVEPPVAGRVLYVGYEGNVADLVRRLRSADLLTEPKRSPGAWATRLAMLAHDEEVSPALLESLKLHPQGIARLSATLRRDGPWVGIVIDTLAAALPEGLDENSNADMTLVCSRLQALAQETGCWVLVLHHPPKASAQPDADLALWTLGRGAGGIIGTARALAVLDAPSPGQRRLRFQVNVGATPRPMLFEVAPEDKPDEVLYWKPTTLEDVLPESFLRPDQWISTTELGYLLSRIDRSEKLTGHASRRATATRMRWLEKGLIDVRKGARGAIELRLRENDEVPF